jgi:molybdate transport system substrate-binding protein
MKGVLRGAATCVTAMLVLIGCAPASDARVVRVAAASDLTFVMDDLMALVADIDPTIDVQPTFGSSGQFLQQISNGAPFDLYLSADQAYPEQLIVDGYADADDLFTYAVGRIVVWTTRESLGVPTLDTLADPQVRRVAIANPRHAPYGQAAVAAIASAGLTEIVEPKLVLGENVSQAAEFVLSGSADVGIIALSLVLADTVAGTGAWSEIPVDDYPRIQQGGVVLARATDIDAARTVRDAFLSPAGQGILRRYGFFVDGLP